MSILRLHYVARLFLRAFRARGGGRDVVLFRKGPARA